MKNKRKGSVFNYSKPGIAGLIEQWKSHNIIKEDSAIYRANNNLYPKKTKNSVDRRRYYLGKKYPGIYLTTQEARCMFYFLQGCTTKMAATAMNLSSRTVSFYSNNIRIKVPSHSKLDLVYKIYRTDFINHLETLQKLEKK